MSWTGAQANRINVAIAIWQWGRLFQPDRKAEGHPPRSEGSLRLKAAGL
jgi:hypothetical protein